MKHVLTKLMAVTICLIFSFPGVAQLPEFNYLNGLYVKKGNGYSVEAKIDFNGWKAENAYYRPDFDSDEKPVERYYGYIKLKSGDHQEGYDIVEVIPSGDGPVFTLASWQTGIAVSVYPSFYNNTLVMDSGGMIGEPYMQYTLRKEGSKTTAKKTGTVKKKARRKTK